MKSNTLSNSIKNDTIDIECPNCNNQISCKLNQVGSTIICPNCNVQIDLEDDSFTKGLEEADKAINDLFRNL